MKKLITGSLSCFAVVLLMVPMAFAQTPDGQTPAEETVCDGLEGSMFGTCNAYCEAMDCDSPNHKASEKACQGKLKKWAKLAGEEPIPCEQSPGLTLSKTVNADEEGLIPIGDEVIYTFTIMNTGNVSLAGIQFYDNDLGVEIGDGNCPEFDQSQTLVINESVSCTLSAGEAVSGNYENVANASAETIYGLSVYAPPASANYTGAAVGESCPCSDNYVEGLSVYEGLGGNLPSNWECISSNRADHFTLIDQLSSARLFLLIDPVQNFFFPNAPQCRVQVENRDGSGDYISTAYSEVSDSNPISESEIAACQDLISELSGC